MIPTDFITLAAGETATAASGNTAGAWASMLIPLIIIVVFFYFIMIRPQKKKEQQQIQMQRGVQIGDEIVTIGGIVGIVIKKNEDTIVIETGSDRSKMRIKIWAISENTTQVEAMEAAKKAAKAARANPAPVPLDKKESKK